MSFEEEFLAKIAEALNVPADLLGQDYLGTLTQTELQAYEASRRFWRESYRMQVAYERAYLNPAIISAMLHAVIWTIESYCGYDPQKLLPSNRRCEMCMVEFEAEHHWHAIREYWIERPHFCEACSQARFLNMAALFDPKVIMQSIYERTGIADFLKTPPIDESTIMFDSPPCRSMAPFVSSLVLDGEAFVTSEGDQISPERVAIISGDYGPVGMRVLAAYADPRVRSILLDMETLDRFNAIEPNHQLRMYALGLMIADRPKKVAKKPPPAYLKHDPTKKHSRRRRK